MHWSESIFNTSPSFRFILKYAFICVKQVSPNSLSLIFLDIKYIMCRYKSSGLTARTYRETFYTLSWELDIWKVTLKKYTYVPLSKCSFMNDRTKIKQERSIQRFWFYLNTKYWNVAFNNTLKGQKHRMSLP